MKTKMSKDSATQSLTDLLGKPVEFNSCNAWGFGGGVGLRWERAPVRVQVFTAYFRHCNPEPCVTVTVDGIRVLDTLQRGVDWDTVVSAARQGLPAK